MTTIADRRTALEARRVDLAARMGSIDSELDSHQNPDWDDLAAEREGDEVLEAMGSSAQQEIRMIDAALARIDAGDYGFCVKCGAEVAAGRLDLLPATPFCQGCAA